MAVSDPREEIFKNMPPEIKSEVLDFAEFLMKKNSPNKSQKTLKKTWAGALSRFKDKYSSVELQKKSLEWRT